MSAPPAMLDLVARFEQQSETYQSGTFNETQLRRDFLDPLFKALGWDMDNAAGYAEAYRDVIHEDAIRIGGAVKAPDYCFRIGGTRKFFLEAKKPSVDIRADISPAYQLRRYAWSAKLPLSIQSLFTFLHQRALPDLGDNLKCGNSLIGPDFYQQAELPMLTDDEKLRLNVFDWPAEFPQIFRRRKSTGELHEPAADSSDYTMPGVSLHGSYSYKKAKVEKVAWKPLREFGKAYIGCKTGMNEAFVLPCQEAKRLKLENRILFPYAYRGEEVIRYGQVEPEAVVIYPYRELEDGQSEILSETELRSRFPNAHAFLSNSTALSINSTA